MTTSRSAHASLKIRLSLSAITAFSAFALLTPSLHSATLVWAGSTLGGKTDWNTKGNWSPASANGGPTSADIVSFDGTSNQPSAILSANSSVLGITFSGAFAYTISSPSFTLTIGASGIVNSATAVETISAPVILGATQSWTTNSGGTLAVTGTVTFGANNLTIDGAGTTNVTGAVSASGATLAKSGSGTATFSGGSSMTVGSVVVNAGTLSFARSTPTTISSGISVGSGGTVNIGATGAVGSTTSLSLAGGSLSLNAGGLSQTFGSLAVLTNSTINFLGSTGSLAFTSGGQFTGTQLTLLGYDYAGGTGNALSFTGRWADDNTLAQISIGGVRAVYVDGTSSIIMADPLNTPAIPEPSTYAALAGVGALALAVYRRRQGRGPSVIAETATS